MEDSTVLPFISHSVSAPAPLLRQRMSAWPSALKSPVAAAVQPVPGPEIAAVESVEAPFISKTCTFPPDTRRMSLSPLASKSRTTGRVTVMLMSANCKTSTDESVSVPPDPLTVMVPFELCVTV